MSGQPRHTVAELVSLYESGMDDDEIALKLGYKGSEHVRNVLRKAGVWRNDRLDKGKVLALHKAGWSLKDIANDVSSSIESIQEVLNEVGQ